MNSKEVRPGACATVVKGQKITLEFQFRRVVFWKDLDDRDSTIQVSVIEQRRNDMVDRGGKSLAYVSSRDGVISFVGENTNELSVGRYGLIIAELGLPHLDRAVLFAGTLEVVER